MLGNGYIGGKMVKEHSLHLMVILIQGDGMKGKYHGQGTWTYFNGDKYVGEWKDDEEWNGNGYNKDGKIISKYVDGKEIKQ